jgi:cell division protein ZapA (FtsZ GTPase activity inhibitor)
MISEPRIDVRIGGRTFSVPKLKDKDTTYHIAKLLQQRLKQIEAKSSRIDTQAFAIEAAMSFALDHLEAEETLEEETREMMNALSELSKDLRTICRDFDVDSGEGEDE